MTDARQAAPPGRLGVGSLALLVVCAAGLVWQATAIRELRGELSATEERLDAVELSARRFEAQRLVTAADRAERWKRRQERRADAAMSEDPRKPLTERPEEVEAWLDELAAAIVPFGEEHDLSDATLDRIVEIYGESLDAQRAVRDHVAAGHLDLSEARQQVKAIREEAHADLAALLGEDIARELVGVLPRDGRER